MAILPILQYPDPRLARPGVEVATVDGRIKKIIADMFETHYAQTNCAALAATQLDHGPDVVDVPRITVIDFSENKDSPLCLVNPRVEPIGHATTNTDEGCMSVKGVHAKVKRAERIRVTALDQDGKPLDFEADGFMAKCIQHECDHLDGVVFIKRLSMLKQKMINHKFRVA